MEELKGHPVYFLIYINIKTYSRMMCTSSSVQKKKQQRKSCVNKQNENSRKLKERSSQFSVCYSTFNALFIPYFIKIVPCIHNSQVFISVAMKFRATSSDFNLAFFQFSSAAASSKPKHSITHFFKKWVDSLIA